MGWVGGWEGHTTHTQAPPVRDDTRRHQPPPPHTHSLEVKVQPLSHSQHAAAMPAHAPTSTPAPTARPPARAPGGPAPAPAPASAAAVRASRVA